jgi:hypothetical protein
MVRMGHHRDRPTDAMTRRERHERGGREEIRGELEEAEAPPAGQDLVLVRGGADYGDASLDARLRAALSPMLNEPVPEEFLRIIAPLKAR